MRKNIKDFVNIVSESLPIIEPIYEFGSLQVPGQVGFADLRPLFGNREYAGCDMQEGPGVDKVLNLHSIDLPSESVGEVLCFDTLEHVEYPRKALDEIYRILKPDGIAVISSVMNFPIHDYPYDYWRFTPEAFKSLLNPFAGSFVGFQGSKHFPHTVVGIGFKGDTPPTVQFIEKYDTWQRSDRKSFRQLVIKLTPPLFLPAIAGLHRTITGLKRID
ncbi:MAG: methyltransferase domain-containing protein [Candidatus Sabulitectum sp.]|nr:methyltransferase domain-containing protein [Candidatus Sabulitectum sp.]